MMMGNYLFFVSGRGCELRDGGGRGSRIEEDAASRQKDRQEREETLECPVSIPIAEI